MSGTYESDRLWFFEFQFVFDRDRLAIRKSCSYYLCRQDESGCLDILSTSSQRSFICGIILALLVTVHVFWYIPMLNPRGLLICEGLWEQLLLKPMRRHTIRLSWMMTNINTKPCIKVGFNTTHTIPSLTQEDKLTISGLMHEIVCLNHCIVC